MCVNFEQKESYQIVRLVDSVSESDISEVISGVKQALSAGIRNCALSLTETAKVNNNYIFTGLLVLCEEMIRRQYGQFALIEENTICGAWLRETCCQLHVRICDTESDFLELCVQQ